MTKGRFATTVGVMVLVTALTAAPGARQQNRADVALRAAMERETVRGDVSGAIADYRAIVTAYRTIDRVVVAQALVRLAEAYQKLDDGQARTTYEQIVRDFSDQPASVSVARTKLAALAALRGTSASPLALVCTGCVDDVASVSNDGRWMAWTDWETGDLVVRDMTSGSVRRLLVKAGSFKDSDAYAQDPVFSRDATRIAYTWETGKPDAAVELRVVSVQPGSSSEVFFRGGEFDWATARAWSPDGMRVLAELRKPDQTLQLAWVSTADGRAQTLKSLDWRAVSTHATLSPDGRFIAYQALVTNPPAPPANRQPDTRDLSQWNIYVLAADGSAETDVTRAAGADKWPLWSPDGGHLFFRSDRSGTEDLWALPVRDGKPAGSPTVVRRDTGGVSNLGISNAGLLYFLRTVRGLSQVSVVQMSFTGPLPTPARIVDTVEGINPSWSADGRLYFTKPRPDGRQSFLTVAHDVITGEEKALANPSVREGGPRYHRSNGEFFQHLLPPVTPDPTATETGAFYSIDLEKGIFREVLPKSQRSVATALSADERTLYQFARDPQAPATSPFTRIVAVDLATAQERTVVRLPVPSDTRLYVPGGHGITLSPDRKTLALRTVNPTNGDQSLAIVAVDGTQFRELGSFRNLRGLAWTPDSRALLFSVEADRMARLMRLGVQGGPPEFTGLEAQNMSQITVSPDGSRVAFLRTGRNESELWALDVSSLSRQTR